MPEEFTEIGSTPDCFFWSALPFGGKLYFGTYGYPRAYNYPPWTLIKTFGAGESVPRMDILHGTIYCATENQGKIYRMNPANPADWVVVHDDDWRWGLGIAACGGYIYAGFKTTGQDQTKTLYSSNGVNWHQADLVAASIPELFTFAGQVYELGCTNAAKVFARRGTVNSWANVPALCLGVQGSWRIGLEFGGYFYVGMGETSDGKSRIYRFDGSSLSGELLAVTSYKPHYACVCEGRMYWLFGPHMNQGSAATVNYHLYRSATGNPGEWEHVKTFATNPILSHGKYRTKACVGSLEGDLYVAIQNKVYKMGPYVPPTYDCPVCEAKGFKSRAEVDTHIMAQHPGQVIDKVFYHQKENSGTVEVAFGNPPKLWISTATNDIFIRNKPAYQMDHRGFLSFDTSSIPEAAVIQSAFIKVMGITKYSGWTVVVDYSLYGTLDLGDWGRVPEQANIASQPTAPNVWRESSRFTQINKGGISQYRLHEPTASTGFACFYAGNSPQQPELHVSYMIPAPPPPPTYDCPVCGAPFDSQAELDAHILAEHPSPPPPTYPCPYCPATFGSQEELMSHVELEHPTEPPPDQITCPGCDTLLTITPPSPDTPVAQVPTPLYCPLCEAEIWLAPTEGYTVSEVIAAEVPWYKKYAPHLIVGGVLAGAIVYLTTRKK